MRRFAKLVGSLLTVLALSTAALQAAPPISIAAARHLPLGTVVTVEGSVTVPLGVFASSFFDEGFAVQDATAACTSAWRTTSASPTARGPASPAP